MAWWERDEDLRDAWLSVFGYDPDNVPTNAELQDEYGISRADLKTSFELAFIDLDISSADRTYWREAWFDWVDSYGLDIADFDWDAWREWYDSTA